MNQDLITTGILLSMAGAVAFSLKALPKQIWDKVKSRLIYTVKVYQTDMLFDLLEEYMYKHYNHIYRNVEAVINYNPLIPIAQGKSTTKYQLQYKQEDAIFIIKLGVKKILVNKGKEKLDSAQNIRDLYYRHFIISGFMAKKVINELLETIVSEYNANLKQPINVYTNDSYGQWLHCNELNVKPFEKVIISSETKEFLKSDIDEFAQSRDWYQERNIPYKRCYCFHGDPGNGKTTIALSISRYLKRDVYSMSLNSFDKDESMLRAFSNVPLNSVILIEDIDRAFQQRENINSKVSFSGLLNCMDGALYKEGSLCVITTNHLEHLDPALIRPGRTDIIMEIKTPDENLIGQYVSLFFGRPVPTTLKNGKSMSQVQEVCIQHKNNFEQAIIELKA